MSVSLLGNLWQTGKYAVGYYRGDRSTLISRGIDEVSPFLFLLVAALSIDHYYGIVPAVNVFRALGITALIGAVDLALILDFALLLDLLIGHILGLSGLKNLLTGLAVFGLGGPVVNYFKAIRNQ